MSTQVNTMEIGISTFLHANPSKEGVSHAQRLRQAIEEVQLADQVGLDVYAIGEHHRADYASSSPAVILAAAAAATKRIRFSSAVTVLSSADPVRVQDFATLDGLSNGRAEIMVGRGSFIESFPLFGYDLKDYEELFDEKLELLLKINASEKVAWRGGHRPSIDNMGIYPRAQQESLPIWIGTGGSPESAVRAGSLGLPIVFSILGGCHSDSRPWWSSIRKLL